MTAEDPHGGAVRASDAVDARGARGVQFGTGNTQNNYYGTDGPQVEGPVSAVPPPRSGDVPRPDVTCRILARLKAAAPDALVPRSDHGLRGSSEVPAPSVAVVGMTTALAGAGGFGKTTLARMLVHDPTVRGEFQDGVVWVTLGETLSRTELADRIDEACAVVTGSKPPHTDPVMAGAALGAALSDRRVLLVLDNVWDRDHLEPFLIGGPRTVRLVTTRLRSVLPRGAEHVDVDAMTSQEAIGLLTAGFADVPPRLARELLELTGRWPLLLGLVNGAATEDVRAGAAPAEVLSLLRDQLADAGWARSTSGTRHIATRRSPRPWR